MKKLALVFALVVGSTCLFSQGNLQFNQVRFIELTASFTDYSTNPNSSLCLDSLAVIVPSGKVLKIESAGCQILSTNSLPGVASFQPYISMGFQLFVSLRNFILNDSSIANANHAGVFPIWLPEGTYFLKVSGSAEGIASSFKAKGFISSIEFNVVP